MPGLDSAPGITPGLDIAPGITPGLDIPPGRMPVLDTAPGITGIVGVPEETNNLRLSNFRWELVIKIKCN